MFATVGSAVVTLSADTGDGNSYYALHATVEGAIKAFNAWYEDVFGGYDDDALELLPDALSLWAHAPKGSVPVDFDSWSYELETGGYVVTLTVVPLEE